VSDAAAPAVADLQEKPMMKKSIGCLGAASALAFGVLVAPTAAHATTPVNSEITFTADTAGFKAGPYASPEFPGMLFSSTASSFVGVFDFGVRSHGQAVGTVGNTAGALDMRLTGPTTGVSFAFGGDDATLVNGTDLAQLTLFRGATQVEQVDVNLNANNVMDQRIGYAGGRLFNRAVFQYVDAAGVPKNVAEIVDDVEIAPLCTIAGGPGNNVLLGTPAADVICGDTGNDVITGGAGRDLVYPGPGSDRVVAGVGNDTVLAGRGNDNVFGGRGEDDLRGGPGRDRLSGNSGRDVLSGGSGRDTCIGGRNFDVGQSCAVRRSIP
jgi:Ca2+-binding RTX toxin-like protein